MKTIRHSETLFYYDGPQVFEARDAIGGHYIGVAVETDGDEERYLVVGVAPERLWEFRVGLLDLRSLMLEGGDGEWFLATAPQGLEEPLTLIPQEKPLAESEHLPKAGFVLKLDKNDITRIAARAAAVHWEHMASASLSALHSSVVQVVGELAVADLVHGWWQLSTSQGPCTGRVKPEGPSLTGLALGSRYRFFCEPGLDALPIGQGCDHAVLFLVDRQPVDA
ncbi:MAG: hypothetical protein Q8M07_04200 [Prosthecobacter sp.]|nr:hypothetical protein [Prosthecobacter sp.]